MSPRDPTPGSREWRLAQLALFGALALWPALWGWSALQGLGSAVFLLLFVWLPGRALCAWTLSGESVLERALLAWTAGMALLGMYFLATCALDERGAWWILPLFSLLALLVARRRRPEAAPLPLPETRELLLLALVIAIAVARAQPDRPQEWFLGFASDDEFHSENAAELRWRWPLGDPRLAGEPLRYHFLAYSISAAMGKVLNLPVRECMLGLTQHFTPLVFALGLFVLARRLGAGMWLAAGAALALVLHADLGELAQPLGGGSWAQVTPFYVGLYHSLTNSAGLCLLAGLLLVLHSILARGAAPGASWLLAFVLALAASATKASVLPPLLVGLALALLWKLVRRGGFDRRLAACTAVIAVGAAPAALWLASDPEGYARTMFRWLPLYALRASGFAARVGELFGVADAGHAPWLDAALLPVWLAAFFGLAGLGLLFWILARAQQRDPLEAPLAFTLLAGLVPVVLLASPGHSELFFGYVSVVAAALLGVLGARRLLDRPAGRPRALAALSAAGLFVYAGASLTLGIVRPTLPIVRVGEVDEFRSALDWMRRSLPIEAVLLADDVRLGVGTWSERRMFCSNPRFATRQRALWRPLPGDDEGPEVEPPYAERQRAQQAFLTQPSLEGLARIHALVGSDAPLYAVRSRARIDVRKGAYRVDVPPRNGADALASLPGAEVVFENPAVSIYRLP